MQVVYKIIICLSIIACVLSCNTPKLIASHTTNAIEKDSITIVSIEKKVDTIKIPADSLKLSVPIKDLTATPVYAVSKNGRTTGSVRKYNGKVEVACFTEKYEALIETQHKIIETLLKINESQTTQQTVQVTKSPWYMKALALIGGVGLLMLIIMVVIKFIKPI
ncbi:MAG: hypothetical protein ACPG6B_01355 [Oceanihabitans sp.]